MRGCSGFTAISRNAVSFEEDFREGITAFYSDNYGVSLNFVTHDELFGRRNILHLGRVLPNSKERSRKTLRILAVIADKPPH